MGTTKQRDLIDRLGELIDDLDEHEPRLYADLRQLQFEKIVSALRRLKEDLEYENR